MTKFLVFIFSLLCVLALAGCTSDADPLSAQENPSATSNNGEQANGATPADWGITLKAKNVTPTGLTIECEQSGGENVAELQTGSDYIIQTQKDGEWLNVEYLLDVIWTLEAWGIPKDSTITWNVKWEGLYGKLPAGTYRIGKEIMNRKSARNHIKCALG